MFWNQVLSYKCWGLDDSAVSGKVLLRLPLHKLMYRYALLERPGFCMWAKQNISLPKLFLSGI